MPVSAMARVVIIENDRIAARDLSEILRELGHEPVGTAATFEDGVALVDEFEPDLALIDIHIDGNRDGIALAGELREEHSIALAFLTGHADHETVMHASATQPNGYLIKPFDNASVNALVNTALANFRRDSSGIDAEVLLKDGEGSDMGLSRGQRNAIERFIARNLGDPIRNESLADLVGLGTSAFARQFHASFGMTPHQYIVSERIAEAKRLLRNTTWPISQIALAIGFSNQAHFATTFKKAINVTPLGYRKATR